MVAGDEEERVEEEAIGSGPSASGDNKSEQNHRPVRVTARFRAVHLAIWHFHRMTEILWMTNGRGRTALRQLFALPAEMMVGGRNAYSVG